MRSLRRLVGAAVVATLALAPTAARAAVTGSIEGTVTDQSTGKKLAGVTVTVTSSALQGEQTEFTDPAGHYIITELPPGEYLVRFYFSDKVVERPGVFVNSDRTLAVNIAFPTQQATVKTYVVKEKAPTVDVGNTQVQTQVTSELVRNTPVRGRTYDAILTLAPGASTDPVGFSFNGATGPENNFLIDGVNTTNPAFGLLGTRLTLEFVGETEIITGGYNAEYGRATGGLVNVITKSGSNQFHGGVWFYATPFQLDPSHATGRAFEAIARRTKTKFDFDFGFDLGGPIVKDKVWFYVGFAPSFLTQESTRVIQERVADHANGAADYQGDLDTSAKRPSYLASDALNTGGGYVMRALDSKYNRKFDTDSRLYNFIVKLNFQLNPNNSLVLQYLGSPGTFSGILGVTQSLNQAAAGAFNGDDAQRFSDELDNTHDASLHYVSKLADRRLQLDVLAGYHFEDSEVKPRNNGANVGDLRVMPLYGFENNITDCKPYQLPGAPAGSLFNPCPVQNYSYGGLGFANHTTSQRISVAASGTYFARAAGTHAIKLGFDFEDNIYSDHRFYSGGALYAVRADGRVQRQMFGSAGEDYNHLFPDGFSASTNTLNYGLYLRDSYNVGFIPGLTVNAGLRWEAQEVKDINGKTQIGIYDNIAPRVGAIYDFTRKGRSKIYASYGWFYESIPLDINDRQFSKEGLERQNSRAGSCMYGADNRVDINSCKFNEMPTGGLNGGTFGTVSPVLKGMYTEEVVAGIQYDVGLDLVLGAAYIHRDLGRIIEDMSPDGGVTYIIGNPGDPTNQDTVRDLQRKIASAQKENRTDDVKSLTQQLALYQGVQNFEKPKRNYDALVITANKRLSHNFLILASYTYSRTLGNYPGLFQQSNNQLDPNISTQYDLKELLLNRSGPLPNDRPHNLKIQGSYFVPFGKNNLTFGLAFNAISGQPIEVLGSHPTYGGGETFILPRGSGGRTPLLTSFDLHVGYRRQISKIFSFDAYADIFNLFNQQEVTLVDQIYTTDDVLPIKDGKPEQLRTMRTVNGSQPLLNPNYGHPLQYQAPLSMRLGVRLSF